MKINKIIFSLLILPLLVACNENSESSSNLAKDFNLKSMTSDEIYKLENFKGKPLIINFWASWCAPCRKEMPFLESVWKENKNSDLVLIGINVMDDKHEALDTLKEFNISYINLTDSSGNVTNAYDIIGLPVTYFIDRNGEIFKKNYGPFLGKSGEKLFNKNLKEILKNEHTDN
ncbi:MAG: TlpA family protein disulfide reductase [Thermodesulfobacteriota bacterium]